MAKTDKPKKENEELKIVPMDWVTYATEALRTVPKDYSGAVGRLTAFLQGSTMWKEASPSGTDVANFHSMLGMATEVGEFIDEIKKPIMYGKKEIDVKKLVDEAGDACWYLATACVRDDDHTALNCEKLDNLKTVGNFIDNLSLPDAFELLVHGDGLMHDPHTSVLLAVRIASLASGESPDSIRGHNIAKLKIRMPDSFDGDRAQNKSDEKEKVVFDDVDAGE